VLRMRTRTRSCIGVVGCCGKHGRVGRADEFWVKDDPSIERMEMSEDVEEMARVMLAV